MHKNKDNQTKTFSLTDKIGTTNNFMKYTKFIKSFIGKAFYGMQQ